MSFLLLGAESRSLLLAMATAGRTPDLPFLGHRRPTFPCTPISQDSLKRLVNRSIGQVLERRVCREGTRVPRRQLLTRVRLLPNGSLLYNLPHSLRPTSFPATASEVGRRR